MRPIRVIAILFVALASCETSTDLLTGIGGSIGGGAVTQAQAAGNWSFTVRPTTTLACTGGALADGQVITAHLDVLNDGTLSTATSNWQSPSSATFRPLNGTVRFSDGLSDLFLFAATGTTTSGMELRGTITSLGSFTGTLTDPAAGLTPVFGTSGCEYSATGTKTG